MKRKMGRPPKPTALHRLQGTFEPGRHAARERVEPQPVGELPPVPPEWMTPRGKRVWIATLPFLARGTVGAGDVELMAAFCEQAAVHQRAIEAQAKLDDGKELPFLTRTASGTPVVSPYVSIQRRAALAMHSFGEGLGLSPNARARIGMTLAAGGEGGHDDPPEADPWARFTVVPGGRKG